MVEFDPEALQAAAESARQKAAMGSNATDQLAPAGSLLVEDEPSGRDRATDLRTQYMGLSLRNPLVASAGPLSQSLDGIKALSEGGVGAIVMYSLFEEQIRHESAREAELLDRSTESFAEALSYFPIEPSDESGLTHTYLKLIEQAAPVIDVPLIASLNGSTKGEWSNTARQLADAGAAGVPSTRMPSSVGGTGVTRTDQPSTVRVGWPSSAQSNQSLSSWRAVSSA